MNTTANPQHPYPANCKCRVEQVQPNATIGTPAFPGIVRFAHTRLAEVNANCIHHGYMLSPDFHPAADLRYAD